VVYCGLPGVGKSTASEYTAEQLSATRYRSDEVRYDLFDDPDYTPEEMARTYEEMLDRTRTDLESGRDVVVDGTFKLSRDRERAKALAEDTGAALQFVRVTCPAEVVRERIVNRTDDASDADLSVYETIKSEFNPLEADHVVIDNGGSLAKTYEQVNQTVLR
jgi:predicted kinase